MINFEYLPVINNIFDKRKKYALNRQIYHFQEYFMLCQDDSTEYELSEKSENEDLYSPYTDDITADTYLLVLAERIMSTIFSKGTVKKVLKIE